MRRMKKKIYCVALECTNRYIIGRVSKLCVLNKSKQKTGDPGLCLESYVIHELFTTH